MENRGPSLWRSLLGGTFVLLLLGVLWARRPPSHSALVKPKNQAQQLTGNAFGTTYEVRWLKPELSPKIIEKLMVAVVQDVNQSMSTYHPQSELSRFNRSDSTSPLTVSEDLARVLEEAVYIYQQTEGALDPTVGPLVDLWGFGPGALLEPPSEDALNEAKELVGLHKVQFNPKEHMLQKNHPNLAIDLSAIAKGYAVDRLSDALMGVGLQDHLVEIGGEVRAHGRGPNGRWRVGVEKPQTDPEKVIQEIVALDGQGMATSGNYRNFVTVDGRKITHIIDPRSGEPVDHGLGSVTVLSETCMRADALATALYVLGDQAGYDWAVEHNVAALFLTTSDGAVKVKRTPMFARRVDPNP
ncbi:MAG: FAD:protein FMN transferase [Myxococcales bacterium]|nr:FAD:protein FMN transferase [Myxococcales bacterium]